MENLLLYGPLGAAAALFIKYGWVIAFSETDSICPHCKKDDGVVPVHRSRNFFEKPLFYLKKAFCQRCKKMFRYKNDTTKVLQQKTRGVINPIENA